MNKTNLRWLVDYEPFFGLSGTLRPVGKKKYCKCVFRHDPLTEQSKIKEP